MGWFDHRHRWVPRMGPNEIFVDGESKRAARVLLVEDCSCGAFRTIEYGPGINPVIREALTASQREQG